MILLAYSLLDTKTGHYSPPWFMNHRGHAIRAVQDLGHDVNTQVGRHPADFELVEIGVFDDQSGVFTSAEKIPLGTVLSLMPPRPRDLFEGHVAAAAAEAFKRKGNGAAEETV